MTRGSFQPEDLLRSLEMSYSSLNTPKGFSSSAADHEGAAGGGENRLGAEDSATAGDGGRGGDDAARGEGHVRRMRREPRLEHGRVRVGVRSRVVTGARVNVARPPADPHCQRLPTPGVAASRPGGVCKRRSRRCLRARYETQNRAGATQAARRCAVLDGREEDDRLSGRPPQRQTADRGRAVRTSATRAGDANRRHRSGGGHGVGHDSRHVSSGEQEWFT